MKRVVITPVELTSLQKCQGLAFDCFVTKNVARERFSPFFSGYTKYPPGHFLLRGNTGNAEVVARLRCAGRICEEHRLDGVVQRRPKVRLGDAMSEGNLLEVDVSPTEQLPPFTRLK